MAYILVRQATSLLQRKLRMGYARAARIIEEMEEQGIIGPADGARPREVLISSTAELESSADVYAAQYSTSKVTWWRLFSMVAPSLRSWSPALSTTMKNL